MNGLRYVLGAAATFSLRSWSAPAHDALTPAGPQAAHIHDLWTATLVLCAIVFAAILLALGIVLWRTPRADSSTSPDIDVHAKRDRTTFLSIAAAVTVSAVL